MRKKKVKKGEYEKDFMKIKFNSDDNLPLNKMLKLHTLTVIVRSVFEESSTYNLQVFFRRLYELWMLEYDRIDISEGIDINRTNASKESDICHHWSFFGKKPYLYNSYHDLMEKATNFNDFAIVSINGSHYRIHFWYMSKNDAANEQL